MQCQAPTKRQLEGISDLEGCRARDVGMLLRRSFTSLCDTPSSARSLHQTSEENIAL